MLTPQGCRLRRERLLRRFPTIGPVLLGDPLNLRYFANFSIDAISQGADSSVLLLIRPDGRSTLYYEGRLASAAEAARADELVPVHWYDGNSPGAGISRLALRHVLAGTGGRIHDSVCDPLATELWDSIGQMRRAKDPDEVEQLRACMRVAEAGQAWAREHVRAGMTELQVYEGIFTACAEAAGRPVVVYGDFAVSPGPKRIGGMATGQILRDGDMMIVDFSVVIQGYRSDFTNTMVVGGRPRPEQQRLYDLCMSAMESGQKMLRAGASCREVYRVVRAVFDAAGMAEHFIHHAGHGLGLTHPEAPFFVPKATETLVAGDVVTLEPGLYVEGTGGIRIEHNYLITQDGYQRLSNHTIALS